MSNTVFILYENFYDPNGETITIGGVQTYIRSLCYVIQSVGLRPVIFQFANRNFNNIFESIHVYGVDVTRCLSKKQKLKKLYNEVEKHADFANDIIIFASNSMIVKHKFNNSIAIQHGISWDKSNKEEVAKKINFFNNLFVFYRAIQSFKIIKSLNYVNNIVCVDYNFLNWYRSQVAYIKSNVKVIPNFAKVKQGIIKKQTETINIIYARRFQKYRGTRIFASAIIPILKKYKNVRVTFAGTGPDELYLKKLFKNNPNVNFIKYDGEKSIDVHQEYDIAVVPSICSEGTSLSLLEAMASKCAVIATNVGGITNIVLDNYNALLINPNVQELFQALEKLIVNKELRERLAENAYQTVYHAFNSELWEKKWTELFKEILK
ncbi:glycosyltransferase family 4 protein [Caldicoprobacter faecalis]|nr:glycosyltransferase family 4 protein [Caldicoprobacter faecalis]